MSESPPSYTRVLAVLARNSFVRDMNFRGNFLIEVITAMFWMTMMVSFYLLIFQFANEIGEDTGWTKYRFFIFLATTMIINGLMQAFVLPNAAEFSELIRLGNLDFALVKPIDTQFLISFQRVNWSGYANIGCGIALMIYSLIHLSHTPSWLEMSLFVVYVTCGLGILYSLVICLASTSVWMGRNQSLYNFWFYITTFSRYPMEIYRGPLGDPLRLIFTFMIPIMIAINVPAQVMAKGLGEAESKLAVFGLFATMACLAISRWIFGLAISAYRSASS